MKIVFGPRSAYQNLIWYQSLVNLKKMIFLVLCRYSFLSAAAQQQSMDLYMIVTLNSFNYYEWKSHIEILLRNKDLYRVTIALEIEPNAVAKKARWHNRKDEAYGFLCLSLSLSITYFPY